MFPREKLRQLSKKGFLFNVVADAAASGNATVVMSGAKPSTVGRVNLRVTPGRKLTLAIKLTPTMRSRLRRLRKVTLTLRLVLTDVSGHRASWSAKRTFRA